MNKTAHNPPDVHDPLGPYAHQILVTGAERLLFLSGQVGIEPDRSAPESAIEQFEVALQNVMRNLAAAGLQASDLVKLTIYLVDELAPAERGAVLERHLGEARPCMTLVYVPKLAAPHLKVELDAWAVA